MMMVITFFIEDFEDFEGFVVISQAELPSKHNTSKHKTFLGRDNTSLLGARSYQNVSEISDRVCSDSPRETMEEEGKPYNAPCC